MNSTKAEKTTGVEWHIESVAQRGEQFVWRWRKSQPHGKSEVSRSTFQYYYDCVEDARKHGYTPEEPALLRF